MIKRRHSPYSTSCLYSKSEDSTKTKKKKKIYVFFVRVAKRTQLTATFLMMLMLEKLIWEIRDVLLNAQKYVKKCYLNIKCVECGKITIQQFVGKFQMVNRQLLFMRNIKLMSTFLLLVKFLFYEPQWQKDIMFRKKIKIT